MICLTPVRLSSCQMANESLPTPTQFYYSSCLKSNNFSRLSDSATRTAGKPDILHTNMMGGWHTHANTHKWSSREMCVGTAGFNIIRSDEGIVKTNLQTEGPQVHWQQSVPATSKMEQQVLTHKESLTHKSLGRHFTANQSIKSTCARLFAAGYNRPF